MWLYKVRAHRPPFGQTSTWEPIIAAESPEEAAKLCFLKEESFVLKGRPKNCSTLKSYEKKYLSDIAQRKLDVIPCRKISGFIGWDYDKSKTIEQERGLDSNENTTIVYQNSETVEQEYASRRSDRHED